MFLVINIKKSIVNISLKQINQDKMSVMRNINFF